MPERFLDQVRPVALVGLLDPPLKGHPEDAAERRDYSRRRNAIDKVAGR